MRLFMYEIKLGIKQEEAAQVQVQYDNLPFLIYQKRDFPLESIAGKWCHFALAPIQTGPLNTLHRPRNTPCQDPCSAPKGRMIQ